jgi:DNA replicative helicase MCM subunit Mcm2 (Cdc46/Mcm family)
LATMASGKLSEMFEDFLKSISDRSGNYVYRTKISQLVSNEGKSLVVDFGDLLKYNSDLANKVIMEPDSSLASFKIAAFETMRSENAMYADRVKRELSVRIRGIPDLVPLRKVDTSYLDRMLAITGMVVRTSELRPLMTSAAWACPSGHLTFQDQDDMALKRPPKCELCGEARNFELDKKKSRFIDFQILRVQELPEELPPGQLPQFFDVNVDGDMVNLARPGDRVLLTGIVRAVPDYSLGQVRTRLFRSQIDCTYVEVKGKEPDQVQLTKEDEELIRRIASSPDAYDRLTSSIAPVILGHQPEKEAILLLLAGGSATSLPDGTKLRGDINALFVGDPGCLVADERVVLGNGTICKIGELGRSHLQEVNLQVLTGEGGARREWATRFHKYEEQPVMEIVTESGKSIRGTHNHPLLRLRNEDGRLVKEWCRLDNFKVGDRVVTVTGFPCTVRGYVKTGFRPLTPPKYGPRFGGTLPERMTPDLAALCGYMLGDGWVDEDGYGAGFVVAEPEVDVLPRLLQLVRGLFGIRAESRASVRKGRSVPLHYVYMSSKDVCANLSFLREKRVPGLIFMSGNEVVSSFLAWLFEADGTVFARRRGSRAVGLKAKDIELLRDVQILLLRFGIHSRIVRNALLIRRGRDVIKFAKHIGFVSRKKKAVLARLAEESRKVGRVRRQRFERVVKIIRHGLEDVYDVEVPNGHRFIANGVVSHNTGKSEMLKFASQVAPRGLYASGRGTTAAGLSAAVIREKNVLMLEAGVVVLADQGIACVTEDTEVYTGQGLVRIGKVWDQTTAPACMTKTGRESKRGLIPVSIYDRKQRADLPGTAHALMRRKHVGEVVKLTFSSGLSLKVTPEHLLKKPTDVMNLWVRADQVNVGDELRAPVKVFGPAAHLDYSVDEAYVIGSIYGDGRLGPSSIAILQSGANADSIKTIVERMPSTFAVYEKGDRPSQVGKYVLISRMEQLYTTEKNFVRKTQLLLRSPSTDNLLMLKDDGLWAFLAGVFDTDGEVNHSKGGVISVRLYPTRDEHELSVLLYALRRLGVYGRITGKRSSIPTIQISGGDTSRFTSGIRPYSVKLRKEPEEIFIRHKSGRSMERGRERVVGVERIPYDGYVYDLSVGKYHNYEAALVYVHNCIDEFEKMKPEDRTALHEMMEQHTVTIAKGGIYATLNARTAILAACNPVLGRYNPFQNLMENIGTLPIPLLTRFDLIFVFRDQPTPAEDERLAAHILSVHAKGSYATAPPIEFALLKKYLSYAKRVSPRLTKEASDRIKDYYLELRKAGNTEDAIPPTPRTLEALVRVATARARILLREEVKEEDALAAIALMNRMVEDVLTDAATKKTDFGIQLGKPMGETKNLRAAMEVFKTLEGAEKKPVERKLFKEELLKSRFSEEDAEKMIRTMFREGMVYESKPGFIRRLGA